MFHLSTSLHSLGATWPKGVAEDFPPISNCVETFPSIFPSRTTIVAGNQNRIERKFILPHSYPFDFQKLHNGNSMHHMWASRGMPADCGGTWKNAAHEMQ